MDQDVPHRISPPSRTAPGPRYSLVFKLVFWPHQGWGGGEAAAAGAAGAAVAAGPGAPAVSGLARPEWGPPQRIGSAAFASGGGPRRVYAPSGRGGGG
jgi:hypothetical protein